MCVTQIFGTAKYNLLKIQLKTHTLPHKISKNRQRAPQRGAFPVSICKFVFHHLIWIILQDKYRGYKQNKQIFSIFFLKNIINIILFLFFTLPHQSFSKNILHLSGYMIKHCHTYYGLKDKRVIFQLSFMTENDKTFCAKLFIVLSQTFYHSAENELKHG